MPPICSDCRRLLATLCLFSSLAIAASGCGSPPVLPGFAREDVSKQQVAEYQQRFLIDGDPKALDWLLAHRIENGMSVEEVSSVLGDSGEKLEQDGQYKNKGGFYQTTDQGYRWGPDRQGRSVTLFFREGRLIQFDPDEFAS